jgi:hypothetical protein
VGYWDQTPATPLGSNHLVGIWTAGGTLLGTGTVLTNSPITDGFRFAPIDAPVDLLAGQTYVIGALIPAGANNDNLYISGLVTAPIITTAPEITYGQSRANFAGFGFPGTVLATAGRFGPDFQFVQTQPIPEPASLTVFGLALVGLAGYRLRRRKQVA